MTRINVGILPEELCDQMLLAELRELPRCYKHRTTGGPDLFTLGTGHVLWCSRYQMSLHIRHEELHAEAVSRGFNVTPIRPYDGTESIRQWSHTDEEQARPLLLERIALRISEMKRTPRWTNREAVQSTITITKEAP